MSKKIKVEVSQDTVNYIHAVDLEVNSRKTLLGSLADQLGVSSKAFKDYQKEFIEFDAEYQLIKNKLQSIYVPDELTNGNHDVKWALNFSTNLIEIDVLDASAIRLIESNSISFQPRTDDLVETFYKEKDDEDCSAGCACSR